MLCDFTPARRGGNPVTPSKTPRRSCIVPAEDTAGVPLYLTSAPSPWVHASFPRFFTLALSTRHLLTPQSAPSAPHFVLSEARFSFVHYQKVAAERRYLCGEGCFAPQCSRTTITAVTSSRGPSSHQTVRKHTLLSPLNCGSPESC